MFRRYLSGVAAVSLVWRIVDNPRRFGSLDLVRTEALASFAPFTRMGPEPLGMTMVVMAAVAAAVNLLCLRLIKPLESQDVNMKAAETFSANDFVANAGIVVAGVLVMWTNSFWPDVAVGVVVALVALKGGLEILKDAGRDASSS